jgi:GNAT superfamily N-acetyltransferase
MFVSTPDGNTPIRRALPDEDAAVADLWLRSRKAAGPAIPPSVHTDAEVRSWLRDVVLPSQEVWVIGSADAPQAMMVLSGDWIEQLYVAPGHQRRGHGSRLVTFAQSRHAELNLHAFTANHNARAFYEKHGFSPTGPPSSDNEEGAPALCYRWRAGASGRRLFI